MNNTYKALFKQSTAAVRATLRNVRHQVPALALAGVASLSLLSSCIEEAVPSGQYTQKQLNESPKAKEGSFYAIPARIVQPTNDHYQFGWGAVMHARDVMTGDLTKPYLGYDHFRRWSACTDMGQDYVFANFLYMAHFRVILDANICIKAYTANVDALKDSEKGILGAAYAFRAMSYLDVARMFEFLPNEHFPTGRNAEGNVVTNLTVPIVTEAVTQQQSYNNPRATHAQMLEFILSDLDKAEGYITNLALSSKDIPHLDVVYGLKARAYMWDGQHDKAAEYARKAITAHGGKPLTEAEWVDKVNGFNNANNGSWMMSATMNKETLGERYNLCNWTGWMSAEAQFGYAALGGVYPRITTSLYNRIADTDFRKLSFKAPKGHALEGKTTYVNDAIGADLPSYTTVKFRPGQADFKNYQVGAACSYPLMRLEEMYLIEAEAVAHTNPTQGQSLINTFMQQYRDKNYNCTLTDADSLVNEIVLQKRIELWGEGQTFFDIKRLNLSVTRAYQGTNVPAPVRYNTVGRPAWMNIVLPKFEGTFNTPVFNYNNPDPSGKYKSL